MVVQHVDISMLACEHVLSEEGGVLLLYRVMHVQHVDISMMACGHALHVEGWPLLLLQGDGGTDVIKHFWTVKMP